ncbi:UDP-4-amino-4,6-dideoxy-N-acetyl-beta-L-altrosamine transaminase [Geobacillus thermoleovorans]|uniref:Spore coat protein n=2 Tax=Geobacillus TaxID=129337 RepID=A0A7U9P6W0_GEOTM|nr:MULTISPECIES: UDP-4-amino-4,6-dideoxy-N-acetyl-beta-L-altrosamine transaminase [Geobacillus]AUI37196.1 UDP-4-amino-4,6-dideoxy-N-acetyl-beta-L-altrosamine transaminase [[Bacillus] caldolyticus]ESU72913.1 spore coat protein [Geobacillus sp. MAS1]UPT60621.1 UDP-4-amino-4,6-dideoxy-N-acetyl-beta-L-altrosamine transaminase [Geobacillus thermoleovorans]
MKLAIHGGTPVRESFLSYGQQWIDEDDIEAVVETLRSPFITQGPKIQQFEESIARYAGAKYAVAFANGTAALHGACFAAGISRGDEVITTPITFAASANCVLYVGGTPVFVDIDEKTYNIDPSRIEKAITSRTKAIIAVDFTGQPADLDPIREIARKYGLVFIEDAAHSLGSCYKGKKVGSLADMTMFSFHPVKHITTGEGGIIVTDDEEYYHKLKRFRTHGIITENVNNDEGPWYYEMVDLGYNYRMTDLQAALGLSQLTKLDAFVQKRREIAAIYNEAFSNVPGVRIPYQLPYVDSSWHLYVLQLQLGHFRVGRKEIFEALRAENIGVHVHYIPVYFHPYYQRLGYKKGICPVAEKWYEGALTIPIFPKMSEYDIRTVIEGVNKVLSFYRK